MSSLLSFLKGKEKKANWAEYDVWELRRLLEFYFSANAELFGKYF